VPNRKKKTTDVWFLHDMPIPEPETTLGAQGVTVRPRLQMAGPDVIALTLPDEHDLTQDVDVDRMISVILAQFPVDVIAVSPNRRHWTEGSYVLLNAEECNNVMINLFKSFNWKGIFEAVSFHPIDYQEWSNNQFAHYFPVKGTTIVEGTSHFPKLKYFNDWIDLMNRTSMENAKKIWKTVWEEFFVHLGWVPYSTSSRMWQTKTVDYSNDRVLPYCYKGTCPFLAVNAWVYDGTAQVGPKEDIEEPEREEGEEEGEE
jgi:hypothetical protein